MMLLSHSEVFKHGIQFVAWTSISAALLPAEQRHLIGHLPNLQHGIAGTLYAEGDRTFVIEDFSYDGLGPDAFVYVFEKGVAVSRRGGGLIVQLPGTK